MKRTAFVVSVGLFSSAVVAHANPVIPMPAPSRTDKPQVVGPPPQLKLLVEATAVPVASKCGEAHKSKAKIANHSGKVWRGEVGMRVGTVAAPVVHVELGASGDEATKTVEVSGPTLDCKKPLGHHALMVWALGATGHLLDKTQSPTAITLERSFSAPGYGESKVWLRRVYINGACGAPIVPSAWLQGGAPGATFTSPPGPQQAMIKLGFGTTSKEISLTVPQNAPATATLEVPGSFDCQNANGIPAVDYALLTGLATSGKVEPSEVTFE